MTGRLTVEERTARLAADVLLDAWQESTTRYWLRRAAELEAARPQPGEYTGAATHADLSRRWHRLTDAAQACRARATGADGVALTQLAETAHDLAAMPVTDAAPYGMEDAA